MRSLRFSVVALVVVSLACGGAPPQPGTLSSKWVAPAMLGLVPAGSPYLLASLEPLDERTRQRMLRGLDQRLTTLLQLVEAARSADRATLEPWMRAGLALADELRGKDPANWWRELGFDPGARFVLYGLSVWPVLRIDVANPARLRGVIEHVVTAAGTRPQQGTLDGHAYWTAGNGEVTLIAAVLEREAVAALVPTPALATMLPLVLGTQKPGQSLATATTIPDLVSRHHLMGFMLAYLDARNALDIVTSSKPGAIDAPLHALTGPISPACRTDLERLVAIAPRFVFGYRRLDETGFDGIGVLEAPPSVTRQLARLHTTVPGLASPSTGSTGSTGHPLLALGAAVNPDELHTWLRGITTQLHDHPFTCPWLAAINTAGARISEHLAAPLPPMLRGVRGFSLVVDNATIIPPDVDGHLLIASDHVADLVASLSGVVPVIAGIPIQRDGRPVALPMQQLGLPLRSAHAAMMSDRLVIASGKDSAQRATDRLATPAPKRSPLMLMAFDWPRIQKLLASLGQSDANKLDYLGEVEMSLDVTDDGIGLDVRGTWPATSPLAQPMTQP